MYMPIGLATLHLDLHSKAMLEAEEIYYMLLKSCLLQRVLN